MPARTRTRKEPSDKARQVIAPERAGVRQRAENTLLASPRTRNFAICLLLAVATFALYSPAIGHPFIFNYDDEVYVTNSSHVQAGLAWSTVGWALRSTESSNWHPV